ncbi:NAD(P)H-binding protein [Streptomyces cinerochromogenes]|uniref:NAD(P)H-binding protein n=1 Tax=Streptomyces cinerochromogenes TaxID=66422 RepID=A0ABW7BBH0_9ACTN
MKPWGDTGPRIVVTGATGAVGRHLARRLGAGAQARLLVRDAEKAARLGLPDDAVVTGDYQDRSRLEEVLAGADAVFVVTANPLRPADDANILAAARARGVRRAVKLSWTAVADPDATDLIARWNRDSEALLHDSGLDWTVLRMRSPMSNTLAWASAIRKESVVRSFAGDAPTACVDPRDVAEAAARVLTEPGHESRTYALTGPEELTPREQTRQLADVLRRPLRFEELTAEQALTRWRERLPEPLAQALLEVAERRGGPGTGPGHDGEGDLEALLGHAPTPYRQWAADHAAHFC